MDKKFWNIILYFCKALIISRSSVFKYARPSQFCAVHRAVREHLCGGGRGNFCAPLCCSIRLKRRKYKSYSESYCLQLSIVAIKLFLQAFTIYKHGLREKENIRLNAISRKFACGLRNLKTQFCAKFYFVGNHSFQC